MKMEWAVTFGARLRGLLFRNPNDIALVLTPCKSVHTFGMKYPIDIAFIGRDGRVLKVFRSVGKRKRFKARSAVAVIERFSREESGGVWLKQGDYIGLGCCGAPNLVG